VGSEFGRTPRLSTLADSYPGAGRDHWGAVQSVWFAGGGIRGGTVVGSSDRIGAYPTANPQTPENMAATIYKALGIPDTATWQDELDRPHPIYQGSPIPGLM
jgi:carbohydrate-binding DOMON domain-containing protein